MSSGLSSGSGCGGDGDKICNCIGDSIQIIADSQQKIAQILDDRLGKVCDNIDQCVDKIIQAIDDKIGGATASCDECKNMIASGMGGTLEYAIKCAGACVDETSSSCSPGDGKVDGSTCTGCGQAPCCCKNNTCVPCGDETQALWNGYCNPQTGEVIVIKQGEGEAGAGFQLVASGSQEDYVLGQATLACQTTSQQTIVIDPQIPILQSASIPATFCSLGDYASLASLRAISASGAAAISVGGLAEIFKTLGDINFQGASVVTLPTIIGGVWKYFTSTPPLMMQYMTSTLSSALSCNNSGVNDAIAILGGFGMAEKYLGVDLNEFTLPFRFSIHAACRNDFLPPTQALDAFMANAFDYQTLDSHFSIRGLCPDATQWAVQSRKAKATSHEAIGMRQRAIIDVNGYYSKMRELGYIDSGVADQLYSLSDTLPGALETIQVIQAGAQNGAVADKFGLDYQADQLSTPQMKRWLDAAGVTPETALTLYRGHWHTPGLQSLYEFYYRLQDDKNLNAGGTLLESIKQGMTMLGIPQYWQECHLATMFQPLLKRDIHTTYITGSLTDDDLVPALRKTGHDSQSVDQLASTLRKQRAVAILGHIALRNWTKQLITGTVCNDKLSKDGFAQDEINKAMQDSEYEFLHCTWSEAFSKGLISKSTYVGLLVKWGVTDQGANSLADALAYRIADHQVVHDYVAGQRTKDQAQQKMESDGVPTDVASRMLGYASDGIQDGFILDCIRGIKHRYVMGEIDAQEATNLIVNRGIDTSRANQLVSYFDCTRTSEGTHVSVAKLCEWLGLGAISAPDFIQRLLRLGYSQVNASLLLADCARSYTAKQLKEAEAASKKALAAEEKAIRDANRATAAAEKSANTLRLAREKQQRTRAMRDSQLYSASEKLYKVIGGQLSASIGAVQFAVNRLQSQYALSLDESLKASILAAEVKGMKTEQDYQANIDSFGAAAVAAEFTPPLPPDVSGSSVNGSTQPSAST